MIPAFTTDRTDAPDEYATTCDHCHLEVYRGPLETTADRRARFDAMLAHNPPKRCYVAVPA